MLSAQTGITPFPNVFRRDRFSLVQNDKRQRRFALPAGFYPDDGGFAHRIMLQANDRSRHLLINKKPSCPRSRALQDPLNLAASYPPFVPWFRECELRHGRTAMMNGNVGARTLWNARIWHTGFGITSATGKSALRTSSGTTYQYLTN